MRKSLFYAGLLAVLIITGCGTQEEKTVNAAQHEAEAIPEEATESTKIPAAEVAEPTQEEAEPVQAETVQAEIEREIMDDLFLEAEDAVLLGNTSVSRARDDFSGSGYVTNFHDIGDGVRFTVNIEESGHYDLIFSLSSAGDFKSMAVVVNDSALGDVDVSSHDFSARYFPKAWLNAGANTVELTNGWGYVDLDSLTVRQADPIPDSVYTDVRQYLCNPNATIETVNLYNYLLNIYGKKSIIGHHPDAYGMHSRCFQAIRKDIGLMPALMELDLMNYSTSRIEFGGEEDTLVRYAQEFDELGGIIAISWHWNAPSKYLPNTEDAPWWSGFYDYATDICLERIMYGQDEEGYNLLREDIDRIAIPLLELQELGIPVLWRPLHEANGGWFWWGAKGPVPYKELYRMLYDRLVNYHGINNLIWVWNADDPAWYPGDDCVDIGSIDFYAAPHEYSPLIAGFLKSYEASGRDKMQAAAEVGVMIDPDLMERDNVWWLWVATWCGEYIVEDGMVIRFSEKYTELEMARKIYNHERTITLDELQDWKNGVFDR